MNGFQWVLIRFTRRPFSTLFAVACLTVTGLSTDLFVSFVRSQTSSLASLDSDYDLLIGPKSGGISLLLEGLGQSPMTSETIPYALVRFLDRKAHLDHRIPIYSLGHFRGCPVIGTDEAYWNRPEGFDSPRFAGGRPPSATDEIALGSRAASLLGLETGDSVKLELPASLPTGSELRWSAEFRVTGVVRHPGGLRDDSLLLPIESAWAYYRWALSHGGAGKHKNDEAVSYILVAADPGELDFVETKIHEGSTVQVVDIHRELAFLKLLVHGADQLSGLMCLLILLLASLVVAVMVNARFDSLKQELGVLRALGYTRGEVTSWLTLESVFPVLAALVLILVLEPLVLARWGEFFMTRWNPVPPSWPMGSNFLVWGIFLATSLLATALPLLRLYRNDIRTAMEGV